MPDARIVDGCRAAPGAGGPATRSAPRRPGPRSADCRRATVPPDDAEAARIPGEHVEARAAQGADAGDAGVDAGRVVGMRVARRSPPRTHHHGGCAPAGREPLGGEEVDVDPGAVERRDGGRRARPAVPGQRQGTRARSRGRSASDGSWVLSSPRSTDLRTSVSGIGDPGPISRRAAQAGRGFEYRRLAGRP